MTEEILTINTEENVVKTETINPLPVYNDDYPMLQDEIPEYIDALPNPEMSELIKQLKMTMKMYAGLGLSANQCGVYHRVFVIGYENQSFACINPKIVSHSDEVVRDKEGCLSYFGMYMTVPRYKWIEAEFLNEMGEVVRQRFEGLTARCFQHELDHMNGIRFVDHVGPASVMMARKKQEKLIKQIKRNAKKR